MSDTWNELDGILVVRIKKIKMMIIWKREQNKKYSNYIKY
jgi:hypothetical protein